MGAVPDSSSRTVGSASLKLLDARAMLIVDYHGAILGIHIHAVDAPPSGQPAYSTLRSLKANSR